MQQSAQDGKRGNLKDTSEVIDLEQDKLKGRFVSKWRILIQKIGYGCHPLHAWWHYFHLMKEEARASISWRWEVSAGQTSGKWWKMGGWLIGDIRVLLSCRSWVCNSTSAYSAMISQVRFSHSAWEARMASCRAAGGSLRHCVWECTGHSGLARWLEPQLGSKVGRAFILTLKKKMTIFPNAFHLV